MNVVLPQSQQLPEDARTKYVADEDNGTLAPCIAIINQPLDIRTALGDSIDVFIQDQNSPIVNVLMHQDLGSVTLASSTVINSRTIELEAGHGASATEQIYLLEDDQFYQGVITNVAVNTLTMDILMDKVFTTAAVGVRANPDMSVDGSSTPITFHIKPPPDVPAWDITQVSISIVDNQDMDDTTFGALAALTNGVLLRKNLGNGTYTNIGSAKTNGELRLFCEADEYAARAGAGQYGFSVKCVFQPSVGVVVRLDPELNEELEIVVQDDLIGLLSLAAVAQGHEVVD